MSRTQSQPTQEHTFRNPVTVPHFCPECGQVHLTTVEAEDLERWANNDGHIQDIFPYLTPAQRELFLSGICGDCFDKLFPEDCED